MTPTMEEVAEWMRKAGLKLLATDEDAQGNEVLSRGAQVEAMGQPKTCDTCEHWDTSPWQTSPETRLCLFPEKRNNNDSWGFVEDCGPKFGCVHYEAKPQPPVKK